MNIVYLIGNGFDRNLGLKTSYKDFYNYYINQESENDDIKRIKDSMAEQESDLWSDLEIALGKITDKFDNSTSYIDVLRDISDNLRAYVKKESDQLHIESSAKDKLQSYLCSPFGSLTPETNRLAEEHFNSQSREIWNVDIITFNYTDVIEKILGDFVNKKIGIHHNSYEVKLRSIRHIHGTCDSSIIVGVNDTTQISNEIFKSDIDLLDWLVKPNTQECRSDGVERICKALINNANLICIFGMSFGDTDKLWWQCIKNRISANPAVRVVIYEYANRISFQNNRVADRGRYRRGAKRKLLSTMYESLESRVFCDINTDMFNLKDFTKRDGSTYEVRIPSLESR